MSVTKIRNQKAINSFGKKIKTLRKAKGYSQYNLADEANIDRSQVIAVENGTGNPTISTIYALAEALKVKPKDLLE